MAIALFNGSYGLSAAGFRVRILEESTGIPAVITLQDGTVVNSNGEAVIDAYGNLSVYLDTSKTYGVHLNQYKLPAGDTSTAVIVKRTALQLASPPSTADIELGAGATFVDVSDPSKTYRISNDGHSYIQVGAPDGITTINGLSNAVLFLYKRATSAPTLPNLPITYTFATSTMTGISQGWSPSVPAGTDPIWVTSATASSSTPTDTITPGEWVTPVIFSQNGINSATVYLFQRTGSSTPPNPPDVPVIYTFATGTASGLDNGWSQSMPTTGGGYRWTTTGTALATGGISTDVINPSEWAPVSLLAQDGANGPAGMNSTTVYAYQRAASTPPTPSATTNYTFSTNTLTGLNNGWSTSITAGSSPLYVTAASATSAGDTDTIGPAEWAAPVILVQNGADGTSLNTATIFLYQRTTTATAPTLPSAAVTYTFSTGTATGITNGWSQTLPNTGGGYRWLTTATALSSGNTDLITPVEWATAATIGQDGAAGAPGTPGTNGSNGAAGLNNAVVLIYQRSATGAPTLPSATVTYTFATASVTGLNNGWTSTLPAGTDPIYISSATASSNTASDTIANNEWATPIILSQNGTNGINTATVYLFQRTATATPPSVPSGTITYTFGTGVATNITNGWSQTVPTSGGAYRWVITATALSNTTTDTIAAAEWSTPAILAQDGATGAAGLNVYNVLLYQRAASTPSVPSATVTYTFSTSTASGLTNGWTQTIPTGTNPLYVTSAPASSTSDTDTILTNEWAAPVILVSNGVDGLNSATVYLFQRTSTGVAPALPTGTVTYTFTSGVASGLTNGWTQNMPTSGGSFRWMTLATALGTGATDTIGSTEWTAAALIAQDGVNGANGAAGQRGSQTFNVALSGSTNTYSDSLATTTASANGGPILNDIVTQYNTSMGYSQSKYWNGTGWVLITQVIDGSLLATGSVSTPALAANAVTATNIAANAITAKSLALTDLSNLVPNPSGYNGTTNSVDGWVNGTLFSVASGFGAYYTVGVNEYTLIFTGSDQYGSAWFPVKAGDQFYGEFTSKPSGTNGDFDLSFGIQLATTSPGTSMTTLAAATRSISTNPSGILTSSGSCTVPATYGWARLWVHINTGSLTTPSNGWNVKNFVLRRKNGANLIVDGSISAQQISASAGISASQIDSRGLSIKDASGNVILSAGTPLANQIVAGSGNLFQNGDFALSFSNIPANFSQYNNDSVPSSNTVYTGGGAIGTANMWRQSYTGASTSYGVGYFLATGAGWAGWQPSTDYVWSFYAKVGAGTSLLGSTFFHAWNHPPTTANWLQNPPLTTSWQRYVIQINFGTATLDANGFMRTSTLVASGDSLDFSCVQIETGTVPSGWAPLQYVDSNGNLQGNPSGSGSVVVANSAMQLGGRNLVTKAAQLAGGASVTTDYFGQQNAFSAALGAGALYRIQGWTQHDVGNYSVSFWIKTSVATTVEFDMVDQAPTSGQGGTFSTTTSWQFKKWEGLNLTSSLLNNTYFGFMDFVPTAACTIYVSNLMLEYGNKASNWTAAPEDAISKDLSNAPSAILNSSVSIGSNGVLNNAGGGQVTIGGLGYTGALNATADINLVGRGNYSIAGNVIGKVGGITAWDTDIYTLESYVGGAFASAICPALGSTTAMFALNQDPTTDSSYTSLDYAWYIEYSNIYIFESGTNIASFTYSANDSLLITYDGIYVTYFQNGVQRRQVAVSAGLRFYFDSSFNNPGATLKNVKFGPLTNLGPMNTTVSDKLSKTVPSVLSTTISMNAVSGAGFVAGNLTWDSAGNPTGGHGVAITPGGIVGTNTSGTPTFTLNASNGNAYFAGTLKTGTATAGLTTGSVRSSSGNASSTSSINTGGLTLLTYTGSGNDTIVYFDINAVVMTNTNTPCRIQFVPLFNSSIYSPYGHYPEYELTMTQSNPMKLAAGTGATAYNWGTTVYFPVSLFIPGSTMGTSSNTIGFYVTATFWTGSGGGNLITGSSIYVEGQATLREFKA